jgi:FkbM family methyltransferase
MTTFFNTIPKLAYLLSGGKLLCVLHICTGLWYVLVTTEIFKMHSKVQLKLQYKNMYFSFTFESKADIAVCKEVFLEEEYRWQLTSIPEIIIDLGAHVGDTALYYHALYPHATIYALEPDPVSFVRLTKHVEGITEIIPIQVAIGKQTGMATLYTSPVSSLRGSLLERASAKSSIPVPAMTLEDFYTTYGIERAHLLKFDIEGAEKYLFGRKDAIEYADAYIGEVHGDLAGITPEVFLEFFKGFQTDLKQIGMKNRFNLKAKIV